MSAVLSTKGAVKGAIIGGVAAGVVGIVLFFIFEALGATYRPVDPAALGGLERMLPFQPLVICVIAALVSAGVIALLNKVAPAKAWTIFLVISVIVFLIEFYLPFGVFTDRMTLIALELMHVPAALGIIGGIKRFGFVTASPS